MMGIPVAHETCRKSCLNNLFQMYMILPIWEWWNLLCRFYHRIKLKGIRIWYYHLCAGVSMDAACLCAINEECAEMMHEVVLYFLHIELHISIARCKRVSASIYLNLWNHFHFYNEKLHLRQRFIWHQHYTVQYVTGEQFTLNPGV